LVSAGVPKNLQKPIGKKNPARREKTAGQKHTERGNKDIRRSSIVFLGKIKHLGSPARDHLSGGCRRTIRNGLVEKTTSPAQKASRRREEKRPSGERQGISVAKYARWESGKGIGSKKKAAYRERRASFEKEYSQPASSC